MNRVKKFTKQLLAMAVEIKYDVELNDEDVDVIFKLVSSDPDYTIEQLQDIMDTYIKRVKSYGTCTKKPVQVEFREVRENENHIATLEGNLYCNKDKHFIIKGIEGEEYPVEKDIFYRTYEIDKPCLSV